MGKTLFFYVFWNLVKVFGLASGVIAGIMSFGGLLKPLMDNGLDLPQVVKMLGYAMPAMTTYSYPIAALFACTVVYGRLASDNEVTAFRAAGISLGPLGLGFPAAVLGVLVSLASLAALSYLVPAASLGMERTVVSNLGQLVVNRIAKSHQIQLYQTGSSPLTIFARSAYLKPADPNLPDDQVVHMDGVSIVTFDKTNADKRLAVPDEFYLAKQADAYIRQTSDADDDDNPVQMTAILADGLKFPRQTANQKESALQGGIQTTQYGPFPMQSPMRENTKCMSVSKLQELRENPEESHRMQGSLRDLIRQDQQTEYLKDLANQISHGTGIVQLKTVSGDQYTLISPSAAPVLDHGKLTLTTPPNETNGVQLILTRGGSEPSKTWTAHEARVRAYPDNVAGQLSLAIELTDSVLQMGENKYPVGSIEKQMSLPMPASIQAVTRRTIKSYEMRPDLSVASRRALGRNMMKQDNSIVSELHSRLSFGLSCVVLTLVGYGLGVAFKSGNYLNAFAVSVVPAIVSIVLVVTGQHICENVPVDITAKFHNPLHLGLGVIWSGNVAVLILAVILMVRLRRT